MLELRAATARWLDRNLSASTRLAAGLLLAAGLVAQDDLILRAAQSLVYTALAWLSQPRLRLRRTVVFLAVTVAFNLLTPTGRVLLRIGGFAVTEGALIVGAGKAASLGGLLFISRLMVDSRLRLPGAAGDLLASTLAFLARLMDDRVRFDLRHPVRGLDQALLSCRDAVSQAPPAGGGSGVTTLLGGACVAALLALSGCALIWGRLRG